MMLCSMVSSGTHLSADVEVAVYGEHRVVSVPDGLGEQLVAAGLQEPLQEELGGGGQQGLLAVRGAHVLGRVDGGGVLHLLEGGRRGVKPCCMVFTRLIPRMHFITSPHLITAMVWCVYSKGVYKWVCHYFKT